MGVLPQIRLVSAADGVADIVELRQDQQCAVLHLLHRVRYAIGSVHFYLAGGFIHGELVVLEIEFAIGQSQALNRAQLCRFFEVEVAGVVPAAHVHSRNVIATLVIPVRCGCLIPSVELVSNYRRHAAIIQMRSAMPHAVAFANGNVIHLDGNVMIQAVLPDVGVSVFGNWEGRGALAAIFDDVEAGIFYRGEVEFRIHVAQPGRCRRDGALEDLLVRAVFR